MKRSEINNYLVEAKEFFARHGFFLPRWAFNSPEDWIGVGQTHSEIFDNMLGWDITDFNSGDFLSQGLLLFTLRNGNLAKDRKPFAEKIMIVRENQVTPMHFHSSKMEDIINRGGGRLVIEIHGSTSGGGLSDDSVRLRVDGVSRLIEPGGKVVLDPGESICLEQCVYHSFWGEADAGLVLVGEVSMVNDDTGDNHFLDDFGRFPEIIEDEPPLHLLVVDYAVCNGHQCD